MSLRVLLHLLRYELGDCLKVFYPFSGGTWTRFLSPSVSNQRLKVFSDRFGCALFLFSKERNQKKILVNY